jgi:tetratricopeptide (TPR) repeat protein
MWKNPIITLVVGLLIGLFVGYLVGQGQPMPGFSQAGTNPHAGVPGAPPLGGAPVAPPEGGRTAATANPRLMEQARELDSLLAKDPNNYEHLVQMGNVQYDMTDYLKAIDYYEKARKIKDDSPDVMTDLGVCYRETKQPRKALELFDRAAELDPNHWQSRYNAAVVRLFDLDDAKGAEQELVKLKKIPPPALENPQLLAGLEQEIAKRLK